MELKGSVVNFLGDSITCGVGASSEEKRFTDVLAREFQLQKANNYGISGSRIARQQLITTEEYDRDYCMRLDEMDQNADAVVVFGGTNDFGHGEAPLGLFEDRDPATFYGACHFLMSGLLNRYVGKPVVILTPLHRWNEEDPHGDIKPLRVAPLKVYRSILLEVAQYYGLPVLDLYATSGIQPSNEVS
ncbi:MAG: SGNH/GDSL hydrolase family protein, partial [Clostridia bacterium]